MAVGDGGKGRGMTTKVWVDRKRGIEKNVEEKLKKERKFVKIGSKIRLYLILNLIF